MVELAPKVVGEIALGVRHDIFADAVADAAGDGTRLSADGTIVWAVSAASRIRVAVATDVQSSGLRSAFSRATRAGLVAGTLRPSDDLRLEAGGGIVGVDYTGIARRDTTRSAFALADHDLSRFVAIVARYDVERTTSYVAGVGQVENRLTLVMRLRR